MQALPGAVHVVVRRAGHLVMLEHPLLVNEHLCDLVERAQEYDPQRARREVGA